MTNGFKNFENTMIWTSGQPLQLTFIVWRMALSLYVMQLQQWACPLREGGGGVLCVKLPLSIAVSNIHDICVCIDPAWLGWYLLWPVKLVPNRQSWGTWFCLGAHAQWSHTVVCWCFRLSVILSVTGIAAQRVKFKCWNMHKWIQSHVFSDLNWLDFWDKAWFSMYS